VKVSDIEGTVFQNPKDTPMRPTGPDGCRGSRNAAPLLDDSVVLKILDDLVAPPPQEAALGLEDSIFSTLELISVVNHENLHAKSVVFHVSPVMFTRLVLTRSQKKCLPSEATNVQEQGKTPTESPHFLPSVSSCPLQSNRRWIENGSSSSPAFGLPSHKKSMLE
jgi:hypothetical protein